MAQVRSSNGRFASTGVLGRRLTGGSFVKGRVKRNALARQLREERASGKVRGTLGTIQAANRFLLQRKRGAAVIRFDRETRF